MLDVQGGRVQMRRGEAILRPLYETEDYMQRLRGQVEVAGGCCQHSNKIAKESEEEIS